MTLLETYCPLRATSLDEASQDVEKFSRGPPDNVPGRSRTSHTFDARSNQDTTSSDGESVGPIDSPESADSIQPELAFLVCTTVQEMESLARNCILVEESYQRYFVRNCGTQKEEAVWRQQGMREEATARQATKAISQIHINEMWARVGYYNNEAAQRSNLFRMLVLEKKKLDNDCRAENKESSSNSRQPEKRRRRPNGFCLDGSVSVEIKGMLVSLKPTEESNPVHPAATSSSSVSACRTALVHNPYSFDGPSQVTMNTALGDAGASTCSTTPSAAASTPVGGMGAVLKRIAPDPRPPPPDISKMLLQFPPPAPRTSTRAAGPTSGAQKLQVHAMLMPFLRGAAGQGRDPPKTPPGSESSPGDHPSNAEDPKPSSAPTADTLEQSSGQVEPPPPEPPKLDAPPLPIEPPPPEAAVEVKDAVASEPCAVPESLAQLMGDIAEQLAEKAVEGNGLKKRAGRHGDEPGEDHSIVASFPTCSHIKFWKRLRANRGFAYFVCYQCGAKWRTSSKGMRHPTAAAAAAAQCPAQPSLAAEGGPEANVDPN